LIASLGAALAGAAVVGAALWWGPSEHRNRSFPHPVLVAATFVVIYSLQAILMRSFYDGGQGDNRYQLAILNQVQSGNLLGDYYYRGVPAHYPPLVFWLAGGLGKLMGLGPMTTLRWMPVLAILLAASGLVWLARRVDSSASVALMVCFAIGSFAAYYLFSYPPDRGLWMVLVEKPQQLLGGVLCLSLPVVVSGLSARPWVLVASVTAVGAALALTMPIFLPIAVISGVIVAIFVCEKSRRARSVLALCAGLVLAAAIASPYLVPPLRALMAHRSASGYIYWQSLASLDISHWTLGFGFGIPLFFAALSIRPISRHQDPIAKHAAMALGAATALSWLVYLSAFVTYPMFGWSLFSWWATVPALLGTSLLASWGISVRLREYVSSRRELRRISTDRMTRAGAVLVVAFFAISWSARTDDFLAYSHSPIDPDFKRAAEVLDEMTPKDSSFVGGQEELILASLSGRGLVYVAHAFYASPAADNNERREAVVGLLHHPSCEKVADLRHRYGMDAVVLSPASRWIPLMQTSNSVSVEEGSRPLEPDDLVLSDLVAERRGDPQRVSRTVLYRASPEIQTLPCLEKVFETPSLVMFAVRPASADR
jgi:hypothetical protein